jgi:hypothetical protein
MEERLGQGIREFNEGRFFEAHDILEDLWHGYCEPDRIFLQALIQMAVGFYHLENRNPRGARSQLSKACLKFEAFLPEYWGISVSPLCASLKDHLRMMEAMDRGGSSGIEILKTPRIQLSSDKFLSIS